MMTENVLFNRLNGEQGDVGEIYLNRPNALNALTLDMCQAIHHQLLAWQADTTIKAVIIRGNGRAFCAGGDLKSLYYNKEDIGHSLEFFRAEYRLNLAIHHFPKPYIAFLDGITMGGGAGISLHGSHRVATEHFEFAMPETGIGFFPDVGSGYFLNKCPGKSGYYLGLSGEKINAPDAMMLSLIGYYVPSDQINKIILQLREATLEEQAHNTVSQIINQFCTPLPESSLVAVSHLIDDCFRRESVEAVFDALDVINSPWADRTFRTLMKCSPFSLKVSLHYLQKTRNQSIDNVMEIDFNLALRLAERADFYEGIRARIIDKDQTPHWNPAKIVDVSDKQVAKCFAHEVNLLQE